MHAETLASGAHRLSGLVLILCVPLYLWLLTLLTGTPEDYQHGLDILRSIGGRFVLWLVAVSLVYHWANGLRFLLLDAGIGEHRRQMRLAAQAMLALAAASVMLLGIVLW